VVKNLGASTGQLLASPELLRRQGVPEGPEDLHQLDTVAMSWIDGRAAWTLLGPDNQEFLLQHQPRYVADDLLTLKLAMLAGTGMSFLPDSLSAAERQAQLLVPVLPGWALRAGVAHAVFPSRRRVHCAAESRATRS
jgi:DNA-binding transcriptional LysR family regulator